MIHYVEPAARGANAELLHQYFRLRKSVFCDELNWVKANDDGTETDALDGHYNVYILNSDDATGAVNGGVRLMPTTGPTLLHEVWPDMLPDRDDFRSPNIWEATRFCVAPQSNASRKGNFVNRATLALSVAVMEFGAANGISAVIGVCERKFFDMSSVYGAHAEIVSTKTDANGLDICCGLWSTRREKNTLSWAKMFVGAAEPVLIKQAA